MCHLFEALKFILEYFQMMKADLELDHALHVLDKRQLDIILCNDAKHLMSATKSFTTFYSTQEPKREVSTHEVA